jgi:predicted porin
MKKSLVALAAMGAFASGAMAQSSVTIYGIVDLGLVKQNEAETATNPALGGVGMTNKELNVAQATRSRLGFKGVEDLGDGLKAKFHLEHRLSPDTGAQTSSSTFWDKSVVGLAGGFGEVQLGRDYMPVFYPQYILDPWYNQGIAMMGGMPSYTYAGYLTSARANNGIWYMTPNYDGFTGMVALSMSETDGVDNRIGFNVAYAAGPIYAAFSYDQQESTTVADRKPSLWTLGLSYDFGMVKPRFHYAQHDTDAGGVKPSAWTLSATIPVGTNIIKVGYAHFDADAGDVTANKFSLGLEYPLSKRTALYTDLAHGKVKNQDSVTGFDFGIRHSF